MSDKQAIDHGTITTIRKGNLEACVSSFGAELQNLRLNGLEYLWQGDPEWWDRRAPVLFPIVGVLRDDAAETSNGPTHLKIHGLAWNYDHRLISAQEDSVTYEFAATDETLQLFPYRFRLQMVYTVLDDDVLEQTFRVINDDKVPMPFFIGGHPAFNCPIDPSEDEEFDDYVLKFTRPWTYRSPSLTGTHLTDWDHTFDVIEDSDTKPLTHRTYDIDTITFEDIPDNQITLEGTKSGRGVTLQFPDFDYCGSWSAMNDGPYVALEPWTGMSTATDEDDIFEHKRGVTIIDAGATFEASFTIKPF